MLELRAYAKAVAEAGGADTYRICVCIEKGAAITPSQLLRLSRAEH